MAMKSTFRREPVRYDGGVKRTWLRRIVTISAVWLLALVLLLLLALWVVVCILVDLATGKWRLPTLRLVAFALCWSWLEAIGVSVAGILWLVGRGKSQPANYALQRWWAKQLIGSLRITCGFGIDVEGVEPLSEKPLVCLGRHASLGDALVSAWVFGSLAHRYPRYVMKKELLLDPCLDVVGQRIPNYFVDRGSAAIRQEIDGIRAMAANMIPKDVAVIFPEGTRTNDEKRVALVQRLEKRAPELHAKLVGLERLLPPRSAGAAALLEAIPEGDVVLLWHVGFDGLDTFAGVRRRLTHAGPHARVVLESHDRASVPSGAAFESWLDDRWLEIDRKVVDASERQIG